MTEKTFKRKVHEAKVRVMRMDEFDGLADREIPTIAAALRAGIIIGSTDIVLEAYVMLCDLCPQIKPHNQ